jgi:hypothetical protein
MRPHVRYSTVIHEDLLNTPTQDVGSYFQEKLSHNDTFGVVYNLIK